MLIGNHFLSPWGNNESLTTPDFWGLNLIGDEKVSPSNLDLGLIPWFGPHHSYLCVPLKERRLYLWKDLVGA